MSEAYGVGLIVGKFAPLHNGHVLVIQQAASVCDQIVIISYSRPEFPGHAADRREAWLKACFPDATVLVVTPERLASWLSGSHVPAVPANDAADSDHREFVAMLCNRVLVRQIDAVFTSEEYGDGFAAHLTESLARMDRHSRPVHHVAGRFPTSRGPDFRHGIASQSMASLGVEFSSEDLRKFEKTVSNIKVQGARLPPAVLAMSGR